MTELIKDMAVSMGKYIIQLLIIPIILVAFALPTAATQNTEVQLSTVFNEVAEDGENRVGSDEPLIAGKKTKGGGCRKGYCRPTFPRSYEEMTEFEADQMMAGKKKKPGTSGRKPVLGRA